MDTHAALQPQPTGVTAVNSSHRKHNKTSPPFATVLATSSGHTTPQSDLSSTDGDDAPSGTKMPISSLAPVPTPSTSNKTSENIRNNNGDSESNIDGIEKINSAFKTNKPTSKSSKLHQYSQPQSYEQIPSQHSQLRNLYADHQSREGRISHDHVFNQHSQQHQPKQLHYQQHHQFHKSRSSIVVVGAASHHQQPKKVKSNTNSLSPPASIIAGKQRCDIVPLHSSSPPPALTAPIHRQNHNPRQSPTQQQRKQQQQKQHHLKQKQLKHHFAQEELEQKQKEKQGKAGKQHSGIIKETGRSQSNRRTYRIPPHLVPSWLPASALDWTEDDDNDDADVNRHIYLRLKTDEEMEECARPRRQSAPAAGTQSKQKNHQQNSLSTGGGFNGTLSTTLSAPPAATTRSRKQADVTVTVRRSDPGSNPNTNGTHYNNGTRDRNTASNGHGKGSASVSTITPAVSTRKRSRAAAQLDSAGREENGRSSKASNGTLLNGRNSSQPQVSGSGHHGTLNQGQNQHHITNNNGNGATTGRGSHARTGSNDPDNNRQLTLHGNASTATQSQKKARQGHGSSHGKAHASRDQFVKHESRKGWLVCKKCRASVWPPNIGKHDSTCPGQ